APGSGSLWLGRAGLTVLGRRVTQGPDRWWEAAASMTVTFGRMIAGVSGNRDRDSSRTQAQVARALPLGPGYGYRVAADISGPQSGRGGGGRALRRGGGGRHPAARTAAERAADRQRARGGHGDG